MIHHSEQVGPLRLSVRTISEETRFDLRFNVAGISGNGVNVSARYVVELAEALARAGKAVEALGVCFEEGRGLEEEIGGLAGLSD